MNQPLSRYVDYMYSYPHKTAYRPFPAPVSLLPYLEQLQGRKASLYFHIPFCSHKCGYCNLFSLQTNRTEYIATYLDTLHRQAQQLSPLTAGLTFDSFAIGGGTPLLLTVPQLEQLMANPPLFCALDRRFVRRASVPCLYFRRDFTGICRSSASQCLEKGGSISRKYRHTEFSR